ncbi:hypothetical protein RMS29_027485 (plasmid) [Agrobacterium rosae]|uniref:Uncharacterized protein n=1 Tax=Agrobacterium rosae TaxID=1972867 RepID=A0AAW9FNY7_9HYPH|nr:MULTISPECIES: hypothetical protein [Agrobacterium]MCF1501584.1 hypothetical protein [Allorhizobium sp. Av2]MDX8321696.1 hypothetical protein [Agrobacterium sp. rho-8.1]MDX8305159.1 hypothetical protein [Agrobacterium rosae]MDX8311443.1 hypothetical protein [Agrobacterium sp. rho-13.3]MDX8316325.1 hypothetical protein [Agrobacterium rosae]
MNAQVPHHDFNVKRSALAEIAADKRLGRSETRVLLHMIANCELFIHSSGVEDEFHRSDLSFLQPGTYASFISSGTRDDIRRDLEFVSANSVTNQLTILLEAGYIRRFNSIGMRTLFSFMLKTSMFTID